MKRLVILCLLLINSVVLASQPSKIEFTEETLDNGLHVIYAPLRQAPVVHARVVYHVGSRDERPDRQGFAHLFEHMMFRGSAHVAPEEHMKRVGVVGGYSNAFTGFDLTVYVNTVPAQYLDMVLWLEADRMASFKVSDEIFQTERKVVAEEWRMRRNQPYGEMYERFLEKAFTTHPYRWTPIGDMDQLRAASSRELQEFFNTYYVPNNATLVIAGDFDVAKTQAAVRRFFGWIPRSLAPSRQQITSEPEQTEARVVEIEEAVPLPVVIIGYRTAPYQSDDHYALAVLDTILGSGVSSRLSQRLVHTDEPMCVSAGSSHWQAADPLVFAVSGTVLAGKSEQEVRKVLEEEVAKVVAEGVSPEELEKARTIQRVRVIRGRETAQDLADQLGEEHVLGGDAERVNTMLAKIEALTVDEVRKVAAKYLVPEKSTTLIMRPSVAATFAAKAAATQAAALVTAPVAPSEEPIEPRVKEFPIDYPTMAPTALPRATPEFAKGVQSDIGGPRGAKVIVMADDRLPLVSWSLTMRRGSQSDPRGKEGVAWLTAEMLRRGAGDMTMEQFHRDLDSRGISLSAGDMGDHTRLSGSSTSDQLDVAIERTRQMLREPVFAPEEFAKLKEQTLSRLKLEQDSPTTVARNEITTALWGDTPIGRFATPASVAGITLDDVKRFYRSFYSPAEAIFMISGDVSVERGGALAAKVLEDWERGDLPEVAIGELPETSRRRIILVDRPEGRQATVRMGIPAYNIHSDDKFAGSIASQVLTAGIDSRLGKYVRAEKGLAYSVHGVFDPNRQVGSFTASVDTAIESTADAIEAIFKVLGDMRNAEVTPLELSEAQSRVTGRMVMAVQTIQAQAGYRVGGILNDYPIDYYDKYPQRIAEVTAEQVRQVMNKYVDDDRMTIVVVAPAAAVRSQLEKLGEVEVVPMPAKRQGVATTQPLKKAA